MDLLALRQAWIEDGIGPWSRPLPVAPRAPAPPPRAAATETRWASPADAFQFRQGMAAKGSTPEGLAWFLDGDE